MAKKDFLGELAKQVEEEKRTGTKVTRDSMKSAKPASIEKEEIKTPPLPIKEEKDEFLAGEDLPEEEIVEEPVEEVFEEPIEEEIYEEPIVEEPVKVKQQPVFKPVEQPQEEEQPASFNEETFKPVANPKKKLSKTGIIILSVIAAAIVFAIYWFLIAAHIVVPNFVGKKMGDVSNWAKQNKIEKSAIAVGEPEFNFDVPKDIIISQSVSEGSKVKTDTPITFTVSKGPDPDEEIAFPDITEMSVEEIEAWKKENKLLKTNIKSVYNDAIEKGKVITYKIKNGSESDFKRGSVLNVEVSKGVQPEGQVNVIDFTGKTYTAAEEWAKKQKVEVDKIEAFSEDKPEGTIIDQSIKAGANMSNGDRLILTVSKGKGVLIPDFTGYSAKRLEVWTKKKANSSIAIVLDEVYSAKPEGTVVGQDVRAGALVDQDEAILIKVSKFLPVVCNESTQQFNGQNVLALRNHINDMNNHGARIIMGEFDKPREYSNDVPKDGIIEIKCRNNPKEPWIACFNPIAIDGQVSYQLSKGKRKENIAFTHNDIKDLASIQNFCSSNNMACNFTESISEVNIRVAVNGTTYYSGIPFQTMVNQGDSIDITYGQYLAGELKDKWNEIINENNNNYVILTKKDVESLSAIKAFADANTIKFTPKKLKEIDELKDEKAKKTLDDAGSGANIVVKIGDMYYTNMSQTVNEVINKVGEEIVVYYFNDTKASSDETTEGTPTPSTRNVKAISLLALGATPTATDLQEELKAQLKVSVDVVTNMDSMPENIKQQLESSGKNYVITYKGEIVGDEFDVDVNSTDQIKVYIGNKASNQKPKETNPEVTE